MITENFRKTLMSDAVSPHGYVIIYDQNNKILVDKHNLILPAGREYLFRLFAQAQVLQGMYPAKTIISDEQYEKNYIAGACFTSQTESASFDVIPAIPADDNPNVFKYEIEKDLFKDALKNALNGTTSSVSEPSPGCSVNIKKGTLDKHRYLLFSFKIPGDELRDKFASLIKPNTNTAISTLYLLLDKEVEAIEEETSYGNVFSQIVFDSIPLSNVEELNIDYYIYY